MRRREYKEKPSANRSSDSFFKPAIQKKLSVGKPGDKFEQEADSVAEKVVNKTTGSAAVQQGEAGSGIQQKPLAEGISSVQAKELEKEDTVQKAPEKMEDEPKIQPKEEEKKDDPTLQKKEEEEKVPIQQAAEKKEDEQKLQPKEEEKKDDPTLQKKEEEEKVPIQQAAEKKEDEQKLQPKEEEKKEDPTLQKKEEEEKVPIQQAAEKKEDEQKIQPKEEEKKEDPTLQKKEEEEKVPIQQVAEKKEDEPKIQPKLEQEELVQKADELVQNPKREGTLLKMAANSYVMQKASAAVGEMNQDQKNGSSETGIEDKLKSRKGMGSPLPKDVRMEMESGFNTKFSDVRIHTDKEAQEMCSSVGAQAFTYGNDIYFNSGKYNPTSTEGKLLLAHELTHVVQQRNSAQLNSIQRHTIEDCDREYYNELIPNCRKLKSKAERALCYAAAATAYGTCLASAEEVMAGYVMTAAIIAAAVLMLVDGPLPFGDAAAVAILASVGISL